MNINLRALLAIGLIGVAINAAAQSFPTKPIHLIVPYAPGGGTDTAARPLAQKMGDLLGQPVIVENKPGATSVIGTAALARSAPDGYTLSIIDDTFAINAISATNLPYDSAKDFIPVTSLLRVPLMVVVPPSFPADTLAQFVAQAKARPGALNYASLGPTGSGALAIRWLSQLAGIRMTPIPYQGLAPAMTSVMTNETQFMLAGLTSGLSHVQGGRLKAIAVTTQARVPQLPDVQTVGETYTGFDVTPWYGVVVPAGTPREVVAKLNSVIRAAMDAPEVRDRLKKSGVQPWVSSPEEFSSFLRDNQKLWAGVIKATGAAEGNRER